MLPVRSQSYFQIRKKSFFACMQDGCRQATAGLIPRSGPAQVRRGTERAGYPSSKVSSSWAFRAAAMVRNQVLASADLRCPGPTRNTLEGDSGVDGKTGFGPT